METKHTVKELETMIEQLAEYEQEILMHRLKARSDRRKALRAIGGKPKHSFMELVGVGAEIWKDIDVDAYIRELRGGKQ